MEVKKLKGHVTGDHVQLYMFRVPKKNHDAMVELEKKIEEHWRKHGVLQSEFFQLTPHELVKGFTNFADKISAGQDEEVWIELQHYGSREHRDTIFEAIRKDMPMLQLFQQWYSLVTPGENSVMGDFKRLDI